jgi:hypothetical protein
LELRSFRWGTPVWPLDSEIWIYWWIWSSDIRTRCWYAAFWGLLSCIAWEKDQIDWLWRIWKPSHHRLQRLVQHALAESFVSSEVHLPSPTFEMKPNGYSPSLYLVPWISNWCRVICRDYFLLAREIFYSAWVIARFHVVFG